MSGQINYSRAGDSRRGKRTMRMKNKINGINSTIVAIHFHRLQYSFVNIIRITLIYILFASLNSKLLQCSRKQACQTWDGNVRI